ncbi:MAG TPA: LamG-like jellyroll fold domain-containing protein, partial [Planctomycetota bacterium]|nr:LamG-like jellyroll fold domain-containing protein [Planctomycetota bacterium]
RRSAGSDTGPWWAGGIAAAVLLAILLAAVFSRPGTSPAGPGDYRQAKAEDRRPTPPEPTPPQPRAPEPSPRPELPAPVPEPEKRFEIPIPPPAPEEPPAAEKKSDPARTEPAVQTVPTIVRLGRLEQVQGQVFVLAGKVRGEAKAGQELAPGQGIATARDAQATFVFADGSRLDLSGDAVLRDVVELPQKQAVLAQGTLSADVVRQPSGAPMRLSTPAAELTIVGTRFVVTAEAKATRLQVREGLVRLARKRDGALLDVSGGHAATAADAGDFALKAFRPAVTLRGRSTLDLEALWLFTEGKGAVVEDVSGAGDAVDLRIRDESAVRWLPRGLLVHAPTALVSQGPATRISDACRRSHELTVEAWITPASTAQAGPASRSFMLGQGEDKGPSHSRFTARLRTTSSNDNGMPGFMSEEGTVKAGLTHLVLSRARSGPAVFYVDGVERGRQAQAGDLSKWTREYRLSLADEPWADGGQPWLGAYYLVAIYSRALPPDEVAQHFKAGPAPARAK